MTDLRELWVALGTGEDQDAGTDANMYLTFFIPQERLYQNIYLPDQPGNDLEQYQTTTYIFNVGEAVQLSDGTIRDLRTEDFTDEGNTVTLENDGTGDGPDWECKTVLVMGLGEDGKFYPLVAMQDVSKWVTADQPLPLEILGPNEIGIAGAT